MLPGAFIQVADLKAPTPKNVESIFIESSDGNRLEVWRLPPSAVPRQKLKVAVFFHGNAGDIRNFFPFQRWLSDVGFIAYAFDYRGFGKSTGWPSERGLERDSDATIKYVLEREKITPDQLLLFGLSIGTGVATYAASQNEPGAMVLIAPFPEISAVVKTYPLFRPLVPFLWYSFPTRERVARLKKSCFIVAHGKTDDIIPYQLGVEVSEAYRGRGYTKLLLDPKADHNNFMSFGSVLLQESISECEETLLPDMPVTPDSPLVGG